MAILHTDTYRKLAFFSGLLALCVSLAVLYGWYNDIEYLKSILPDFVSMKFNTALCFLLLSFSLIISVISNNKILYTIAGIFAGVTAVYGVLSFLQVSGFTFSIDQLFIKDEVAALKNESNPGRMSPLTAFCFACCGIGIVIFKAPKPFYIKTAQWLFHIVSLMAVLALLGYIFAIPGLYNYTFSNSMALHTAVLFLVFSGGASLVNHNWGFIKIFTGTETGHVMARRLFLYITPCVILIFYLHLLMQKYEVISPELEIAMLSIAFLVITTISVWITAKALNRIDHKRATTERNFRTGIENAPYAQLLTDENGIIAYINPEAEKLFGYDMDELVGKKTKKLVPKEMHTEQLNIRRTFFSDPVVKMYGANEGIFCKHKNGNNFPVEMVITPVITADGFMALSSIIDLTPRVESERLLQLHLEELQHKNSEMEQFNYIASHDLQEPLRTVSNYIMLLEEDYPEIQTPEILEHLDNMKQSVGRMNNLIKSLLEFGRLGKNKKLILTDCNELINNVLADLKGSIKESGTTIIKDDSLPVMYVYDVELRQLFQNLINNAIKFSKPGVAPEIHIGCREIEGYYELSVSDNGIGIESEHLEDIFLIFQRVHNADEYAGYGIGLANCKKIVEIHGGHIRADSQPGEGSTFTFTLINFKP